MTSNGNVLCFQNCVGMNTMATFKAWSAAFSRHREEDVIADTHSHGLSHKLGVDQFSDLSGEQFFRYVHGDSDAYFKGENRALIKMLGRPARVLHLVRRTPACQHLRLLALVPARAARQLCGSVTYCLRNDGTSFLCNTPRHFSI